jgi:secondary thiamine-phosphate synthase enzyme
MREPALQVFSVSTKSVRQFTDITDSVQSAVSRSGVQDGICFLFLPHTTAALTLNENWDPAVPSDILHTLGTQTAPEDPAHRHGEGNSPAHVLSSLLGASLFVLVEKGRLLLGSWQGVFLVEFDGPRQRRVMVKIIEG